MYVITDGSMKIMRVNIVVAVIEDSSHMNENPRTKYTNEYKKKAIWIMYLKTFYTRHWTTTHFIKSKCARLPKKYGTN